MTLRTVPELLQQKQDLEVELQQLRDAVYEANETGRMLRTQIQAIEHLLAVANDPGDEPEPTAA